MDRDNQDYNSTEINQNSYPSAETPNSSTKILMPEMTLAAYANHLGVTLFTVRAWVAKGYLPTIKRGKRRLVNLAQVHKQNLEHPI